jgi:hypothetical protein
MFFAIILSRILFIASMVFITGYVFGSFSKSKTLTVLTKISTILAIVLFVSANVFFFRFAGAGHGWHGHYNTHGYCIKDSSATR